MKWRQPPMDNDHKVIKAEYLSIHWSEIPQVLNLSLGGQNNAWNEDDSNGRWPQNIKYWLSKQPLIWSSS